MDGHEATSGHSVASRAEPSGDAVGAANSTASAMMNSIEREPVAPDVSSPTNPGDPSASRLDWIDPDALETLKRRRQRDLAAAREGMQLPDWVAPGVSPTGDPREIPPDDGAAEQLAGSSSAPQTETRQREGGPAGDVPKTASPSASDPLATPPDSVSKRFLQAGHQYFLRDGSRQMAFEDRGVRMVTAHNRPDIAESMAEMALAKGWTHIRVKGHEDFRRAVWMEAAVRGIGVTGYVPNAQDQAALEELMLARMTNRVEQVYATSMPAGAAMPTPAPATSQAAPSDAGWTGQLIRHGAAPYQNAPDGTRSYFVTLRDAAGTDKTVWGVDLERAMQASGVQSGQTITLSNLGRQPVTITEPVRDAAGQVIGEQPKVVERNVWRAEVSRPEPTPAESPARPLVMTMDPPPSNDMARPTTQLGAGPLAPITSIPPDWLPESEFRGELVAHGRAPYQNRAGAQAAYFATLREADGHQLTVWGADLERAMTTGGAQIGDQVCLANYGRRRVDAEVSAIDGRGDITGTERRTIERYVWRATVEPREPRDRPPVAATAPDDPQRALHMSVIAEAMRAQGFSEKSVTKVQARAGEVMDRLGAQGVPVPAPRLFDPAGRVQQPRSRGNPGAPAAAPEVERVLQPTAPAIPSR